MDCNEILPGRLYGGGKIDKDEWHTLRELGVTAIVNVSDRPDHPPADFNVPVLYFKLGNRDYPSLARLHAAVEQTLAWLEQGHVVYVHDIAGRNRLGFFLAAIFMNLFRIPSDVALTVLRRNNPKLAPRRQFRQILEKYERFLNI
jgi:hypothetical protein